MQTIDNMTASFVNPAFIKFYYAKVIIAWLNLVTNSLLDFNDYDAAKPSAQPAPLFCGEHRVTAVVGFGQMSEHQVLKNVCEILRVMIGDNGSIYFLLK